MCDFLTLLLRDVRDEIRQQHLCGADRLALARTCRALYEEDGPERTDDLSHWLPPSWRDHSVSRRAMAALSREDRPFVAALWRQVFFDRFDDVPYCRHQPPILRLVKYKGTCTVWLCWPDFELRIWQTPTRQRQQRTTNDDYVRLLGPPERAPARMSMTSYSATAFCPPFPAAALPGWMTGISLRLWRTTDYTYCAGYTLREFMQHRVLPTLNGDERALAGLLQ